MTAFDERRRFLERLCARLIENFADKIDRANLDTLNDFVQNYEFGVALVWLESLIAERSIALTDRQRADIQQLKLLIDR